MIYLKTDEEVELLREANLLIGRTLAELAKIIKPGVTTKQLDKVAEEFIRDNGAEPTFKGFPNPYGGPFPASICTSVNEQVVHGIPNDVPLQDGDIVSIDCGTRLNSTRVLSRQLLDTDLATFPTLCSSIVRHKATEWFESLWDTESGMRCMRTHKCLTTDDVVTAFF